jgi:elongation factor Ts
MANYTAADVKKLRDLTGAGMMDCKKALDESDGDFDQAVEFLRIKGAKDVGKRAGRTAANGIVAHSGNALLELNCETDFVAKTDRFQQVAADIAAFAASTKPADAAALLDQEIEPGKTVQQLVDETSAAIGEKLELRRVAAFEGAYVHAYLHKSDPSLPPTTGVLVELDAENPEIAKDVAQQIAAMAPKYLTADEVPADVVAKERELAEQMARDEGKPEQVIGKVAEGRVRAYLKDFVLVDQPFVRENKKTVGKLLKESGVSVRRFARFKVGQA